MNKTRILIADDHLVVRMGLRTLIETQAEFEVAGEAACADEAVASYETLRPDLVLMDLRMPSGGVSAVRRIRSYDPEAKILIVSSYGVEEEICLALDAGAAGYLQKTGGGDELLTAIRAVCSGSGWVPASIESLRRTRSGRPNLTAREAEVLKLIFEGYSNKEIAFRLSVAENTIKNHINNLMAKLNARDRTHAAHLALKRGLLTLDQEPMP